MKIETQIIKGRYFGWWVKQREHYLSSSWCEEGRCHCSWYEVFCGWMPTRVIATRRAIFHLKQRQRKAMRDARQQASIEFVAELRIGEK